MALSQPWGKFGIRGRPAAARAADIRRLEELVDLMPRDALKTAVRRFLTSGSANATDVRALRRMLKWLPRSAVTGAVDLAAIKREVHAGLISPLLVEEEAEIAAQELIRHWFDSLRLAWEAWGERDGSMQLDSETLLPLRPEGNEQAGAWKAWEPETNEALDVLSSSVALRATDVPTVMHEFSREVMRRLEKSSAFDLPDGLCITLAGKRPSLSRRT